MLILRIVHAISAIAYKIIKYRINIVFYNTYRYNVCISTKLLYKDGITLCITLILINLPGFISLALAE